ncbi:MAG: hypothetical protein IPP14_07895 [Planctomycetes bacterium]|nr:hypothetical protein [Planctomycetota bacterium]
MAVKLSRDPGGYSVMLAGMQWLDPALLAPQLAAVMKLPRSDTIRACRLQRGILFEGAPQAVAQEVVTLLASHQIEAIAVASDDLPLLPKPVQVSLANVDSTGLGTPSLQGAGLPKSWDWNHLALVAAGITLDPAQQAAGLAEKMDNSAMEDRQDRVAMAQRALEKARTRVFPLREELQRGEPELGAALQAALAGAKVPDQEAASGFGRVGTVVDILFVKPYERLRLTDKSRVQGLARTGSLARNLHTLVKALETQADSATLSGTTLALAAGADSGDYLFEDLAQFDDYCRWAYFWRLRRQV